MTIIGVVRVRGLVNAGILAIHLDKTMTTSEPARRGPPYSLDRARLEREARIDTFRASGPGGQHVNRTESAIRLTHLPSGVVVTASDTRSQARNRDIAFERLIARLRRLNVRPKKRIATRPTRAARERRLESKRRQSAAKRLRRSPPPE
jgi:protein subunit release factor B